MARENSRIQEIQEIRFWGVDSNFWLKSIDRIHSKPSSRLKSNASLVWSYTKQLLTSLTPNERRQMQIFVVSYWNEGLYRAKVFIPLDNVKDVSETHNQHDRKERKWLKSIGLQPIDDDFNFEFVYSNLSELMNRLPEAIQQRLRRTNESSLSRNMIIHPSFPRPSSALNATRFNISLSTTNNPASNVTNATNSTNLINSTNSTNITNPTTSIPTNLNTSKLLNTNTNTKTNISVLEPQPQKPTTIDPRNIDTIVTNKNADSNDSNRELQLLYARIRVAEENIRLCEERAAKQNIQIVQNVQQQQQQQQQTNLQLKQDQLVSENDKKELVRLSTLIRKYDRDIAEAKNKIDACSRNAEGRRIEQSKKIEKLSAEVLKSEIKLTEQQNSESDCVNDLVEKETMITSLQNTIQEKQNELLIAQTTIVNLKADRVQLAKVNIQTQLDANRIRASLNENERKLLDAEKKMDDDKVDIKQKEILLNEERKKVSIINMEKTKLNDLNAELQREMEQLTNENLETIAKLTQKNKDLYESLLQAKKTVSTRRPLSANDSKQNLELKRTNSDLVEKYNTLVSKYTNSQEEIQKQTDLIQELKSQVKKLQLEMAVNAQNYLDRLKENDQKQRSLSKQENKEILSLKLKFGNSESDQFVLAGENEKLKADVKKLNNIVENYRRQLNAANATQNSNKRNNVYESSP